MKTCKQCGKEFAPMRPMQQVCGLVCARRYAQAKAKAEKASEREKDRAQREADKSIRDLLNAAQEEFNGFIRARDRSKGCFVCHCVFPVGQLGGDFDAGHVRSRGAAPQLRFNEDNCHGECKPCNSSFGAKPGELRDGAERRIGAERVEALYADNTTPRWTREELIEIKKTYAAKRRELEKQCA